MEINSLLAKAVNLEFLTKEEGLFLYQNANLGQLMLTADAIRKILHPYHYVTWIIDRNVNITNICVSGCKFCNFYRARNHKEAYITTIEQYKEKIDELIQLGGNQLLLQGGMHPSLGLDFYTDIFSSIKKEYPDIKLHALGPAEVVHISELAHLSYSDTLKALQASGLDSLPGAGAEILSDRVRGILSKAKCSTTQWLDVMRAAHQLGLTTSATMMFGHIETLEERFDHLLAVRQVQSEKPAHAKGFISFIPWPFQDKNTELHKHYGISNSVSGYEYVKTIALSRIMLPNIPNIQASWLTVGKTIGQLCLHAGANDFGSIMIEENVVSAAGAEHSLDATQMQEAIRQAGFIPTQRTQQFEFNKEI